MGLNFKDLIVKQEISIEDLHGKILAVDALNMLYQFLTTIRAPDGSIFTDSQGNVTSHLIGLFNRTTALMEQGLKLVFVFDGAPPAIKRRTWEKRAEIKKEASLKLLEAEKAGNMPDMKKFASRTSILTKEMLAEAKKVIEALGLPIVQAPSEGEAQAAHLVKQSKAYACISQDYDTLIFGCPQLIRNVSIEGKRKKAGTLAYQTVKPELISLQDVLDHLQVTLDQLIVLAILVGTDYNPGGVKGIGPKTGLKLLLEHKNNFEKIFQEVEWDKQYPELSWKEVFDTIKYIPVTDNYQLAWKPVDAKKLIHLLVQEHDFREERVVSRVEKLQQEQKNIAQKGLGSYL